MHYLNFTSWLFFMTWVIADSVPRYVLPRLFPVYDALEELETGGWGTERLGKPLSLTIQILLSLSLAYILTIWSTWCVLRCIVFTRVPDTSRALYFVTGFICCEYALGKIAKADRHRGFFISVFPYTMAMGAFVVFSMNYQPMKEAFPWLIRWMGVNF